MSTAVTTQGSSTVLRSIGAVVAGLIAIIITHTGTDAVLHATGVFPPVFTRMSDGLFGLALAYRVAFSIFGCYLTARLAPNRPMFHSLMLGAVGTILSIAGAAAAWNKVPELGPKWYLVALVFTAIPCALIGGWLRERRLAKLA